MKNKEEVVSEEVETAVEPEVIDEVAEANARAKASEEKYLRLFAEFDNFKKRNMREKDARYADAVVDTVSEILNIADNLERALNVEVTSDDAVSLYDGVKMVNKQMLDTLEKLGVSEIKAVGNNFDPNFHEAVMHIDDESIDDNTVVEEFRKGYVYKEQRVVRHSMVKVAN